MSAAHVKRLFALDHNFPIPIVETLTRYMPEAELVPIGKIDRRMPELDDWEVMVALHCHVGSRAWDGMVTTDSNILHLPRELSVLMQTKLTLVVAEAVGHDPLKATGLVLSHLPGICKLVRADVAQLWTLKTATRQHEDPWETLTALAKRQKVPTSELYASHKLSDEALRKSPIG